MYDVIIIGSGVAGSTAAYFLADAKVKVLVLEKLQLPRYKTCGGGLVHRAVSLLPFNLDEVIESRFLSIDIFDQANGLHFNVSRSSPLVSMVMRKDLDYFILNKAISKGAEVKDMIQVNDLQYDADIVKVIANNKVLSARLVLGADGAMGITIKKLGFTNYLKRIPAIESEISVGDKVFTKYCMSARFDYGLIPNGYGWVFPKKEHLSVGVLTMKTSGINLNKYLKEYLSKLGIKNIIREEKHGFVIPLNQKLKNLAFGKILLAGDAAGMSDPITAEGISYAVESGKLAAEAIIRGGLNPGMVSKIYTKSTNKILTELKYARMLSLFVYRSSVLRSMVFRMYGEKTSGLLTDISMGEKTYSEIIMNPLNYLKLLTKAYSNTD